MAKQFADEAGTGKYLIFVRDKHKKKRRRKKEKKLKRKKMKFLQHYAWTTPLYDLKKCR